ncbi:MAG: type 1 glutamine amidotransferase [Euryarchaeota archaeon]|nr:type 1 glutamine amidotransferase [Euryarchaeota archaeon]
MRLLAFENAEGEHLGCLEELAEARGIEVEYRRLWRGDDLEGALDYDLLVFLGGPMSVNEESDYPYLAEEKALIRRALEVEKPLLGICLGAQLIASALGARVYPGRERELGWYPITLTGEGRRDEVFSAFPHRLEVFHWHGETFDLPAGARLLAGSELYPHQAFRTGRSYALQYHLEVTAEMVRDWVREVPERREEILHNLEQRVAELNRWAEVFFDGWLRLASRSMRK